MKPPFTSTQEMYNYAANQLIVQNLSQDAVKRNLMEHGVTDADAEIVIQNMMVQIEKDRIAKGGAPAAAAATSPQQAVASVASTARPYGSFNTLQEMYNYAADMLIVKKQTQQATRQGLLNHGITESQAEEVIKNMLAEMQKNKTPVATVNPKRAEGQKMMLVGLVIGVIGGIIYGTKINVAGSTLVLGYGVMAVGAILFFRGLFRMF